MIMASYKNFDWMEVARSGQRSVYVDIDDTIMLHNDFREAPRLNDDLVGKLKTLKAEGVQIVLWTGNARGLAMALNRAAMVAMLGLDVAALFDAVLAKPRVILDDKANWFDDTTLVDMTK